ncbi:Na/Pi cotransporter family protein, partial [bacterium]|nr:Na/Pi cotransporter family protein [bacterium]
MKKTAGDQMRSILSTLTYNRFVALAVGAFVTMVIQSSSATTVMLVSFVQAQLMSFSQSLGIILGANIGTTVTAQIVAFKLTDYALLMVALGMILALLAKRQKVKNIGETIFGFGLLFFGMHIMSESMHPLRTYDPFIELLVRLENPVLGILVGALFTALIQSSSAFTGILIVLAIQGLLTLEAGIPLIFGANIGTCITAGFAAMNAIREARRVAVAHTLFQIIGVMVFIWWIPHFSELVQWISPKGAPHLAGLELAASIVPRQVANAHTIFNITTALVVLPFTQKVAKLITRFLPDVVEVKEEPYKTKFISESVISTPALALSLAKEEILHLGEIVKGMVVEIIEPFTQRKREVLEHLRENEEKVDYLDGEISDFLSRITRQSIPEEDVDEAFQMMYCVTELEQIADIISKNLLPRADGWLDGDYRFSEAGKDEIEEYHLSAVKQVSRALNAFRESDLKTARRMKRKYKKYRRMGESFMRTHFERLREDIAETKATREFHQDLVEQFRRISSHATNIARILLEWSSEENDVSKPESSV